MTISLYVIAKYLRISKDDGTYGESSSIINQRALLDEYITLKFQDKNFVTLEYIDDGYSGTGFQRPKIQELLNDCKKGKINVIIVKDLSRFGRNYLEVGEYISEVLPYWKVRFISVNDNYDSLDNINSFNGLDIIFRNLMNDLYSRDLSVKVQTQKRAISQEGNYIGGFGFFGYKKNPKNRHKLLIDKEAAETVQLIFHYALQGLSNNEIAKKLNDKNILTPMLYRKQIQNISLESNCILKDRNYWTKNMISRILNDERYTGKLISGKTQCTKIGGKRRTWALPKEKWIVIPNAFEPIISEEIFYTIKTGKVQNNVVISKDKDTDEKKLLKGKIKCGGCGHLLRRKNGKDIYYFCCMAYVTNMNECFKGRVTQKKILCTILNVLQKYPLLLNEKGKMENEYSDKELLNQKHYSVIEQKLKVEINTLKEWKLSYYEQFESGIISKEKYLLLKEQCCEKIHMLSNNVIQLQKKQLQDKKLLKRPGSNSQQEITVLDITREIIERYIDSIYVYEDNRIEVKLKGS